MLALGGFRIGTLVKLKYRHVKRDLEKMITPIHIHVEAEITKGKIPRLRHIHRTRSIPIPKNLHRTSKTRKPHRKNTTRKHPRRITQMAALGVDRDYIEYNDGPHHKHIPRHTNERHRISKRHLHHLRLKHKTENTHQQNRRP
jgi:hypothetical protein